MLGLANTDLLAEVSLVNVFASWCVACRAEHPLLMQLAREALPSMSGPPPLNQARAAGDQSGTSAGAGGYGRAGPFIGRAIDVDPGPLLNGPGRRIFNSYEVRPQ
jgi:hypothetical protein